MLANVYSEGDQVKIEVFAVTPHTLGTVLAGSTQLTVADPSGLANGDPFVVAGAGPEGAHLVTTIAAPLVGNVVTLAAAAGTGVKAAVCGKRVDPTSVTFRVKPPTGAISVKVAPDPSITNPLVGKWIHTYDPAGSGTHWWRCEGTGAAKGVARGSFVVDDDEIV